MGWPGGSFSLREFERVGSVQPAGWVGPQEVVAAASLSPEFEAAGVLAVYPESISPGSGGRCLKKTR